MVGMCTALQKPVLQRVPAPRGGLGTPTLILTPSEPLSLHVGQAGS